MVERKVEIRRGSIRGATSPNGVINMYIYLLEYCCANYSSHLRRTSLFLKHTAVIEQ